jgi:hypothetical protein
LFADSGIRAPPAFLVPQLPYDLNTVIFIEVLGIAYAESARQTAEPAKVRAAARTRALNAALR